MLENISHRGLRGSVQTKFSDSWAMNLAASFAYYGVYTGNAVNTSENWQTDTIGGIFRQNNQVVQTWEVTDDIDGRYFTGPFVARPAPDLPKPTTPASVNSDLDSGRPGQHLHDSDRHAAAIDAVYVPQQPAGDYLVPPTPVPRSKTYTDQIYYQEQIEAIPNWVSLVAGWAFIQTESITDTNISANTPYVSTDVSFHTYAPGLAPSCM